MKVISIISEQATITSHEELWNSFEENEWRNILTYFLEERYSRGLGQGGGGTNAIATRTVMTQVENAFNSLKPRQDPTFFSNIGRFISVANRYGMNLQSNETWSSIFEKFAPHKNYETNLPPTGPSGPTRPTATFTNMSREEFIQSMSSLNLPEQFTTDDAEEIVSTHLQSILRIILTHQNRDQPSGNNPSWKDVILVPNTPILNALIRRVEDFANSLPQPSNELLIQIFYWLSAADELYSERINNRS